MNITCIAVGKLKEKFFLQAVDEYVKRLSRYAKVKIVEVPDEKTPDKASEKLMCQIKQTEGERILSHIREKDYVIALAIEGTMQDSVRFARHIEELAISGKSDLVFVIGGSLGLSESVLKRADEKISFSRMTFPHQLMRVILMEQIYRGFRIINGEPYHK